MQQDAPALSNGFGGHLSTFASTGVGDGGISGQNVEVEELQGPLLLRVKISAARNGRGLKWLAYEWKTLIENCLFLQHDEGNNDREGGAAQPEGEEGPLSFNLRPAVQTFYEEPVMETETTLIADEQLRNRLENLPKMARKLVTLWCQEMGHGLHDQPRLEIMSPDAWFLKCTQTHSNIILNGFELGNFINFGLFVQHYSLNMRDVIVNSQNLLRKGEMDLLFEHDCRKMGVRFTLGEYNATKKDYVWHLYRMQLEYSGVHSVVVDFSDKNHVAMYLRLKYPPKVTVDEPKPRQQLRFSGREIRNYGKRTHNFYRTANVCNWGKKLGRSSVLKLLYPVNGSEEGALQSFWEILSRLKTRAKIHVYFMAIRTTLPEGNEMENWVSDDLFCTFGCFYLINALFSRGYAVLDQIDPKFVQTVSDACVANASAAEKALEQLLSAVDENRYMCLSIAFGKLFMAYATSSGDISAQVLLSSEEDSQLDVPKNCVKVRKLIVTPTREMLMPPEVMMANRVLRKFGPEFALRVLFRDEDNTKLRGDRVQEDLFKSMVSKLLLDGRKFGRRHYKFLAWSNSQLRDHGCYMYSMTDQGHSVPQIRTWMGDFTASSNIPKYMSRMGQCFTQAQEAVIIPFAEGNSLVKIEHDIKSLAKDPNGEPYVFSDGIGRISMALAKKVCEQLELTETTPSAYQIRYAGCKGMLSIDVRLDKNPQGPQLVLRDSMKKFTSDTSYALEIVKHSQPSPVYLNRPLIMILDQVSRKQGCGPRVSNEIHRLLEKELFTMSDMLLSEDVSVDALVNRTPLKIDFKKLNQSGFNLTAEPYFRGLLLAVHKYTIKAQLFKAKVEIPPDQGRTMYGVLDETNVLQYGQVFFQFSENLKKPGDNVKVYTGKVMVTKNPCLVPGDVRIFTAVNKEALKHMVDVIVFPRNGPRPHTDEMAGSDLDGDEYAVYWNQNLMFNKNETAMHFPKVKPDNIHGGVQDSDMVNFFIRYVSQDSIGRVANAHLVMADQKSVYDPICMSIAAKCSTAVDFPKTGVPALPLTDEEAPYRFPDFMQKEHRPMYRSWRLLGQLFRKIKMVSDTVELGQVEALCRVEFDPELEVEGWREFRDVALEARARFDHHLQALLDQYGIQDESQLVSGHMVSVRNRISDGEKEDFSFYNTERIVELRINKIFEKFRREFFDDFGGEREELLESPADNVQKKASAYYMVSYAYDQQRKEGSARGRMLSLPWLAWEVLACIKRLAVCARGVQADFIEPVHCRLAKAIDAFSSCPQVEQERNKLISDALDKAPALYLPLRAYGPELAKLLYVILRWCQLEKVYRPRGLHIEHVALLLIHFASGNSGYVDKAGDSSQYILPLDQLKALHDENGDEEFKNSKRLCRVGALCLEFIKYLASQYFRCQLELEFRPYGVMSCFTRREWHYLHSVAFKTYHHVAWTSCFKSLHIDDPTETRYSSLKWDRDELDPVPVQFNVDSSLMSQRFCENVWQALVHCSKLLKAWSAMDEVQMRLDTNSRDPTQYLVVGVGSLEARNKLKSILLSDNLEEALFTGILPNDEEF